MLKWPGYSAHQSFIASAHGTEQLWRLAFGLVLAAGVYLVCYQLYLGALIALWPDPQALLFDLQTGSTPGAMLVLLSGFACMIAATGVAVRIAHKRNPMDLLGPGRLAMRQFSAVMMLLLVVGGVVWVLPPWDMGGPVTPNLGLGVWLLLLPLSLLAVLIQVSAEEILFRGYIQRQLAARFKSPWAWMILPSVLFGQGHYMPEMAGSNAVLIVLWAVVFGVLMADLTARAGTLGPAIAVHFVNNASAFLLVSLPDDLSGLSLYLGSFSMGDEAMMRAWLPVDFAFMIVSWLTARLAIRR
jgi:membrane protease YdiL (CAAX protease family)